MTRLRRMLVLLCIGLGLVALPMRGREPCCEDERVAEVDRENHGSPEQACLSGIDDGEDCEDACLACCPQPLLAMATRVPVLLVPVLADEHGNPPARGPPERDPDERLQVPRPA